jgi:hypothetical protein
MFNLYIQNCHIILEPTIFFPFHHYHFFPILPCNQQQDSFPRYVGTNTFSSNGDPLSCQPWPCAVADYFCHCECRMLTQSWLCTMMQRLRPNLRCFSIREGTRYMRGFARRKRDDERAVRSANMATEKSGMVKRLF